MERIELSVEGMHCRACEASISAAIGRLPHVTSVEADHSTGQVSVEASAPVDRTAIEAAVAGAGYAVRG